MRAENYVGLVETISGSVFSTGGIILMTMGDKVIGFLMVLFGLLMFLGLAKKVIDKTQDNKNWRNEIV